MKTCLALLFLFISLSGFSQSAKKTDNKKYIAKEKLAKMTSITSLVPDLPKDAKNLGVSVMGKAKGKSQYSEGGGTGLTSDMHYIFANADPGSLVIVTVKIKDKVFKELAFYPRD